MRSPLQHCQRRAPPVATTGWSYYRCETCPKRTPPACGRPEPGEPAQRRPRGRAGAEELSTDRAWRWHFAYGANMCRSVLVRRSVRPRETGRAATLAEHELRFCHRGELGRWQARGVKAFTVERVWVSNRARGPRCARCRWLCDGAAGGARRWSRPSARRTLPSDNRGAAEALHVRERLPSGGEDGGLGRHHAGNARPARPVSAR
eukprot:scaffold4059_cov393-Prasinococcus_capsulatus_cf.AAC.7